MIEAAAAAGFCAGAFARDQCTTLDECGRHARCGEPGSGACGRLLRGGKRRGEISIFHLSTHVIAASVSGLEEGLVLQRRPRAAIQLRDDFRETDLATYVADSRVRGLTAMAPGQECTVDCLPWQFGETLEVPVLVSDIAGQGLRIRLRLHSDLRLGPLSLNLEREEELCECVVDLRRILAACQPTPSASSTDATSSSPSRGKQRFAGRSCSSPSSSFCPGSGGVPIRVCDSVADATLAGCAGDEVAPAARATWSTPVLVLPLRSSARGADVDLAHVAVSFRVAVDPEELVGRSGWSKAGVAQPQKVLWPPPRREDEAAPAPTQATAAPAADRGGEEEAAAPWSPSPSRPQAARGSLCTAACGAGVGRARELAPGCFREASTFASSSPAGFEPTALTTPVAARRPVESQAQSTASPAGTHLLRNLARAALGDDGSEVAEGEDRRRAEGSSPRRRVDAPPPAPPPSSTRQVAVEGSPLSLREQISAPPPSPRVCEANECI
eukprot:TRINITY_DN16979_c0_g1_i2.p1 TRINITY_DN16979_c0_g1~~TRINITY_DN16979_c0_g1_i2.p1  ORF type:complete len:499 (-),score=67.97 TRINITY_DN16979_c0_g1_i2:197-1693(-)